MIARRGRRWIALDFAIVFLFAVVLVKPLFKAKYLDKWASIESTFIADARFLSDHWPHPRWQPLWYCGTRFDYVYPPALRYGTAVITKVNPRVWPVKAYHIYIAFFYCLGIAGVYLLARFGTGSRTAGYLAAAATALMSPSFLFLKEIRHDAWLLVPQRLGVLIRYGEGPHITALGMLGFALAFSWLALPARRPAMIALAAIFSALVVSNNFYGATALAMLFPIMAFALWLTYQDNRIWLRAGAIAILAYGLTAFWLTPSYIAVTMANLRFVSAQGNAWSRFIGLAAAIAFVLIANRTSRGRREHAWTVFVLGAAALMALNVFGNAAFDFRVIGEPGRLIPEIDLLLILAVIEGLRRLWRRPPAGRIAACAIVIAAFATAYQYVPRAWHIYIPSPVDYRETLQYQITDWVAKNIPGERVLSTGTVRFWYDAWHDNPELGGGSEQGLTNPVVIPAQWELLQGEDPERSRAWLLATGTDAAIVHFPNSKEWYKDYTRPDKFKNFPVLWDNGAGDVIYRVPRRFPGIARVVDRVRALAIPPVQSQDDAPAVQAYADLVEKGPDSPAAARWTGTDSLRIHAQVARGEALLVQESYDPAWRAYSNGDILPVRKDAMGFMLIDVPPGAHDLELKFALPWDNILGRILSGAAVLVLVFLFKR